jgi:hypothetical protein
MMMWPDKLDPLVSEGEGEKRVPVRKGFLGRGPDLELGRIVSPGAFSCFFLLSSFFFFLFLDLFITFAFWIQINSNQILKFSKIQHNVLKQ